MTQDRSKELLGLLLKDIGTDDVTAIRVRPLAKTSGGRTHGAVFGPIERVLYPWEAHVLIGAGAVKAND